MAITTVHPCSCAEASAASATFFACANVIDGPYGGSLGPAAGLGRESITVLTNRLLPSDGCSARLSAEPPINLMCHHEVVVIEPQTSAGVHHLVRRGSERYWTPERSRHFKNEQPVFLL